MRKLALQKSPIAVVNDEKLFLATYRCMFETMPLMPGLGMGEAWGCHGPKSSTMAFEGKDGGWFYVYKQTEKATREHHRYTQKDKDEYAKRLGDLLITSSVTFKGVYRIATEDLREDLLKVFSHGRVCIVGAALCKHTPNMGNGYNGGIQDLVAAVPGLCRMLKDYPTDKDVETESIWDVLTEYQKQREEDLRAYWQMSYSGGTWIQAGYNCLYWMFERWIIMVFDLNRPLFMLSLGRLISDGKVLPFLPEKHPLHGKVPWKHYPGRRGGAREKERVQLDEQGELEARWLSLPS